MVEKRAVSTRIRHEFQKGWHFDRDIQAGFPSIRVHQRLFDSGLEFFQLVHLRFASIVVLFSLMEAPWFSRPDKILGTEGWNGIVGG
jgi:hypothetical protein